MPTRMVDYGTELEWLRFFRARAAALLTADAEAETRVVEWLRAQFEKETRKRCPER